MFYFKKHNNIKELDFLFEHSDKKPNLSLLGQSGAGIHLGVTSATAANLLNDYEEGTWTPSIGGNASYTTQSGKYTKIGRTVYASALIQINSKGTGSGSTCSGLPFASSHVGGGNMGGTVGFFYNCAVNVLSINLYFANGGTSTAFKGNTSASGNIAGNLDIFGDSARIDFSVVYEVS